MNFFDILRLAGGLALFLFGMRYMGEKLEKQTGKRLEPLLSRFTENKFKGFLTGTAGAALMQSSSAVTVMVVGFVDSGLITLHNATGVIIGSNVGTTFTSWILSLSGVEGGTFLLDLLMPSSLAPIAAVAGILLFNGKKSNRKDVGGIILGFAVLMTGLNVMADSASGIKNEPWAMEMLTLFSNPVLGVIAGALLTAIVQSSSASVGILQTLSLTGAISFYSCVPIVLGQNIGTCATTLIAGLGASTNARRAALIHLYFNTFSAAIFGGLFFIIQRFADISWIHNPADAVGIAAIHTAFNVFSAIIMLPLSTFLEKTAIKSVPQLKNI
ncbi:MAG: Na/Pi symporter [Clostridia bacterium]|nr:Na/Pi symporter [Clostridia bacterium]